MAKITGPQSVPSELLDKYRATLGEVRPNDVVEKRYPYKLPVMRSTGGTPSQKQRNQRARFLEVRDKFKTLSPAERARWYEGRPPWSSLLWYYNYFVLSGLIDVLGGDARGAQVIKQILNRTLEVPSGGTTITHASTIDASKAVVMMWGATYDYDHDTEGDYPYAWAWPIYPIWGTLSNTNISLTWSMDIQAAAQVAIQVIEYL